MKSPDHNEDMEIVIIGPEAVRAMMEFVERKEQMQAAQEVAGAAVAYFGEKVREITEAIAQVVAVGVNSVAEVLRALEELTIRKKEIQDAIDSRKRERERWKAVEIKKDMERHARIRQYEKKKPPLRVDWRGRMKIGKDGRYHGARSRKSYFVR